MPFGRRPRDRWKDKLLPLSIFFDFLELNFLFEKQFFDYASLFGISHDFEHFSIVLNVLSPDKAFHDRVSGVAPSAFDLELDQRARA